MILQILRYTSRKRTSCQYDHFLRIVSAHVQQGIYVVPQFPRIAQLSHARIKKLHSVHRLKILQISPSKNQIQISENLRKGQFNVTKGYDRFQRSQGTPKYMSYSYAITHIGIRPMRIGLSHGKGCGQTSPKLITSCP